MPNRPSASSSNVNDGQSGRCDPLSTASLKPIAARRVSSVTAHRIFERIRTELPEHKVAEVTARLYVRERKRELGWSTRATCVPQSYAPGQEGQVDWYEAWAELSGMPVLLQVFSMRSMRSGAA